MIFSVDNVGISPYRDPKKNAWPASKTVRRRNGRNGWVKSRHVRRRTLERFGLGKLALESWRPHLQFHELVYVHQLWFMIGL